MTAKQKVVILFPGLKFCAYGSIMVASNRPFTATTKDPYLDQDGTWKFNDESTTTTNPLLILPKIPAQYDEPTQFDHYPITLFTCSMCNVQVAYIAPSYVSSKEMYGTTITDLHRVRISTKLDNEKKLHSKMVMDPPGFFHDTFHVYGEFNHTYHYKKSSEDANLVTVPDGLIEGQEGNLSISYSLSALVTSNAPLDLQSVTIAYNTPVQTTATTNFFPEFDITISSEGGIFTKDDADTPFPINPDEEDPTPEPEPSTSSSVTQEPEPEPSSSSHTPEPQTSSSSQSTPAPPPPKPTEKPTPTPEPKPQKPTPAPTKKQTDEPKPDDQKTGLTKGQKAMIGGIVAAVIVLIIVAVVIVLLIRNKKEEGSNVITHELVTLV